MPFLIAKSVSYQLQKPMSKKDAAELQEIDDQIRELEEIKKGFEAKALRHIDQAQRQQFKDRYYLEAKRHMELADENQQAADEVQREIDRLKARRRQILERNGAGDGFEDL
jgi:hypothetical protein